MKEKKQICDRFRMSQLLHDIPSKSIVQYNIWRSFICMDNIQHDLLI